MKKYLWLILVLFSLTYKVFADDVEQKTDGTFVGENTEKPMNSSFVGNISDSIIDDSNNTYFAGDNSDKEEQKETDAPFAGNQTFAGNDYGK